MSCYSMCPSCGHPVYENEGYGPYHADCGMKEKQRIADAADRAAQGLPPNLTRRERRAKNKRRHPQQR